MNRKINISTLLLLVFLLACKGNKKEDSNVTDTLLNNQQSYTNKTTEPVKHKYTNDSIINLVYKSGSEKCKIDSSEGFYIPKNLKESHLVLDTMLQDSTKMLIAGGEESHFGLGMYLRNNWGLWSGGRLKCYFEYQGIKHPDHMSEMIISTYQMKLNNRQINEDSIIVKALLALKKWEDENGK